MQQVRLESLSYVAQRLPRVHLARDGSAFLAFEIQPLEHGLAEVKETQVG